MVRARTRRTCFVPNCDQDAKVRGLCGACYSWDLRMRGMDRRHLPVYLAKLQRFAGRGSVLRAKIKEAA